MDRTASRRIDLGVVQQAGTEGAGELVPPLSASTQPPADLCEIEGFHPDAIERALSDLPDPDEAQRVANLFTLLADPSRVRILHGLAREELCVCDIAAVTELSVSAVSHQLRLLRQAGSVAYRKEGRMAYYRLVDPRIRQLLQEVVSHAR